jgi:hypothetical protein
MKIYEIDWDHLYVNQELYDNMLKSATVSAFVNLRTPGKYN